jgi:pimeloyl-ACP methyl ester carboxylesterase
MDSDTPERFAARMTAAARGVRIPTLLVRGLKSDMVSDAGVAALRAILPQLEVVDVAGAGHMVAGDRNDAFNAGVIDFLERHLRPA